MLLPAARDFSLSLYISASIGVSFFKPASSSPLTIPFLLLFVIHPVFFNSSDCPFDNNFLHKHCLSAFPKVQSFELFKHELFSRAWLIGIFVQHQDVSAHCNHVYRSLVVGRLDTAILFPAFGIALRTWISSAVHHHLKVTFRHIGFPGPPSLIAQVKIAFNFNFLPFDGSSPLLTWFEQELLFRLPLNTSADQLLINLTHIHNSESETTCLDIH